jgi:hypothetical protein
MEATKPKIKPCQTEDIDTVSMASRLLNFVSKAVVNIGDARGLLEGLDPCTASTRLVLANGLNTLHKELHDEVMPSVQARLQQGSTIELLLQELVALEETEYQEKEKAAGQRGGSSTSH